MSSDISQVDLRASRQHNSTQSAVIGFLCSHFISRIPPSSSFILSYIRKTHNPSPPYLPWCAEPLLLSRAAQIKTLQNNNIMEWHFAQPLTITSDPKKEIKSEARAAAAAAAADTLEYSSMTEEGRAD